MTNSTFLDKLKEWGIKWTVWQVIVFIAAAFTLGINLADFKNKIFDSQDETKQELKGLKTEQKDLKKLNDDLNKKVFADSVRLDSMEEALKTKSVQREKTITIIREHAKKKVEDISDFTKPDIRRGFAN